MFCCVIAVSFTSISSFSQDKPTPTEDKEIEELPGDKAVKDDIKKPADAPKKAGEVKSTDSTLEAKTFFDGSNTYVNSKILFKLFSRDNFLADKIEYKVDAGATVTYEKPFPLTEEGKHVIAFYGIDKMGNKEDEKVYKVIVDNTPPEINVTANMPVQKIGDKLYATKGFTFTIDSKDALSGVDHVEYSINGKDYIRYISPFNIPADGELTLKVKGIDNVANQTESYTMKVIDDTGKEVVLKDAAPKFFIDNVAPTVQIKPDKEVVVKDGKNIAATGYKYAVTATDNESGLAGILYRVDGKGEFAPYQKEIMFTTNGDHLIEAKAFDKVGNASSITTMSVFVDANPPETKIETISQ
jgi:hypothetical protein